MTSHNKPNPVLELEAVYGAPSQSGFGSAVFYENLKPADDLEKKALEKYKYFIGERWERYGEDAWMGPWKGVYARTPGTRPDIVAELRGIHDADTAISTPMILDNIENPERARSALSAIFDDPAVSELLVFNLGDGEAMSGILIAGQFDESLDAIFLVFLMD